MRFIGPRIIKTSIAVTGAIWLAHLLDLPFYLSAGILAALGVQATRKQTIENVTIRFLSCLCGIGFAFSFFAIFTFHPVVIGVLILFLLGFLSRVGLNEGIMISIVVVLHIYSAQQLSIDLLISELLLITLGLGTALLINLSYMPPVEKEANALHGEIDELLSTVFNHYSRFVREGQHDWDGREILLLENKLTDGKKLALRTMENRFKNDEDDFEKYIQMRQRQFDGVKRMLALLSRLEGPIIRGQQLAGLFDTLSEKVKKPEFSGSSWDELKEIEQSIRMLPLPESQMEFEQRATFYHLLHELEQYIMIAKKEKHFRPGRWATSKTP
jgi:uncharacterized membrane protein YgaE (UPF0421/DUF939 family)